jgi:hypothetical protein
MQNKDLIFVAWRDPQNKSWYPIAKLSIDQNDIYSFVYTKGAIKSQFPRFPKMDEITEYKSTELFPLFYNRIISEKRPDFDNLLKWLDINKQKPNPLKILALTEGTKPTDHLEFFQCPVKSLRNKLEVPFIVHGLQYLPKQALKRIDDLEVGERLYLTPDPQNEFDSNAIILRTNNPVYAIGYCPRYLCSDFLELLRTNDPGEISVTVKRVNKDAPLGFRLLCEIVSHWPEGFHPCAQEDFEPIIKEKILIRGIS